MVLDTRVDARDKEHGMGYTFYPHQDSNGNDKPGNFGLVLDDDTLIMTYPSINYGDAVALLGEVRREAHDLPLVVERSEP